jgi:hypothetical protein
VRRSDLDPGAGDLAWAALRARKRRFLLVKAGLLAVVNLLMVAIWLAAGGGYFWPVWVLLGTAIASAAELVRFRYAS